MLGSVPTIRLFKHSDISMIVDAFAKHHWIKPAETFENYWKEQQHDERLVWVAIINEQIAGYIPKAF